MNTARKIVFWTLGVGTFIWAAYFEPTGHAFHAIMIVVGSRVLYVAMFPKRNSL